MSSAATIRPASHSDAGAISDILEQSFYVHQHLDWRSPMDWLGNPMFFIQESDHRIEAVLACPPEPPGYAWIRVFACQPDLDLHQVWSNMLTYTVSQLPHDSHLCLLAIDSWLDALAIPSLLTYRQDVVVLEWNRQMPDQLELSPDYLSRPMTADDIPDVAKVDQKAFEPQWVHSEETLMLAFMQCRFADVVTCQNEIIAYQLTTAGYTSAHLARLAVLPDFQHQHIGYLLVRSMFHSATSSGFGRITVNTQSTNQSSLALYHHLGFQENGERYPVYMYDKEGLSQ